MDTKVLKSLLKHDFYRQHEGRLTEALFDDEIRDAYQIITAAHEKYEQDLSAEDVRALWENHNPLATQAEREAFYEILVDTVDAPELSEGVISDVIHGLWQRHIGTKIANIAVEIADGNATAMQRLKQILEQTEDGFMPDDFGDYTSKDIEHLLKRTSDENRWKFNISTLSRHVYGIGPGEFATFFALPETGKTAFAVSLCAAPDGFCDQGARVFYLGNEEATDRTMLRAMQAWSGMTKEQCIENPALVRRKFELIEDKLEMVEIQDWTLDKIEAFLKVEKPDVVVLDQADKVNISGNFNASHERLRELYRRLRETAKRYDCALIVVSQASNDAAGKTRLSAFHMEGSKIGKAAETDLIIGIGRHEPGDIEDTEPDMTRYLTVSKNKLSGWHGTVICQLKGEISRYVE